MVALKAYIDQGNPFLEQEARMKQAYELIRTSGYPSIGEAIHLIYEYLHKKMTRTREGSDSIVNI